MSGRGWWLAAGGCLTAVPAATLAGIAAAGADNTAPRALVAGLAAVAVLASGAVALRASRWSGRRRTREATTLAAALRAVAEDLSLHELPTPTDGDLALLAGPAQTVVSRLRETTAALAASREEPRSQLQRLGDTLSSTHDLGRILTVILETAMAGVRAQAGAVLLTSAGGGELYLFVGRGLQHRLEAREYGRSGMPLVRVGSGVAGTVAATGAAIRGRVGGGVEEVVFAHDEPAAEAVIAVPLRSSGQVTGVLCLYDSADGGEFTDADLALIRAFAAQAAVAVDNVLLHQEARRLSITDGLTGLWNYRYFTIALTREVERAARFQRPLALLMLDIDRFKALNDAYGHQRGNEVLMETAERVRAAVREVDVVARYGGEEIALLLPETGASGAEQLAERVWSGIRERPFTSPGEPPVPVRVSLGIAIYPEHGRSAPSLLASADVALYAAKSAGRDCWRLADRPAVRA